MTEIHERNQSGIAVFVLNGRIDSEGAVDLDLALHTALSEGKYRLVLDMTDLTYINSAGLRTLADVLTQSQENGGDLKLAALSAKVRRVFEIVGFDNFFSIYETPQEAVAAF
jgi:anti-anti-sigma factor